MTEDHSEPTSKPASSRQPDESLADRARQSVEESARHARSVEVEFRKRINRLQRQAEEILREKIDEWASRMGANVRNWRITSDYRSTVDFKSNRATLHLDAT